MVAERGSDPRTSGLWAQHASTAFNKKVIFRDSICRRIDLVKRINGVEVVEEMDLLMGLD